MAWTLSDFLNLQRLDLVPRPISEFARIGEKAADTFERLEKSTRESLDEAVRGFATTKNWPVLSDEQTVMLYFRLSYGVELGYGVGGTCTTSLFPPLENRDSEMISGRSTKHGIIQVSHTPFAHFLNNVAFLGTTRRGIK